MKTAGGPDKKGRALRWCAAMVLILATLAMLAGATPRAAPAQETGWLSVRIVDETGAARGGACVLVVDGSGSEQKVCDDDGDGTLFADGLAPGGAKVVPVEAAAGCKGGFGGEVEIPAGGTAELTLTGACEPLPPVEGEKPAAEEKPAEEEKPTEEPKPADEPTPTAEVKPTEEPLPTATATPSPTPTVAPPPPPTPTPTPTAPAPTTGELVVTLTSATYGSPSLGACWEVLDQVTFATVATGCDGDDGANDGARAFAALAPGRIVVQQISGDHNDNPAEAMVTRIVAGKTTSVALTTMPLADLIIVPVSEDGVTPLYDACFAVYRGTDYSIGRDACSGPDGRAVFTNLPAYYWRLEETIAPAVTGSGGLRQPYTLDGPPSVYHDVGVDKVVIAPHHLQLGSLTIETIGADFGQPIYGACAQVAGGAGGPVQRCDSDLDGQIVLTGLAIGNYTVTVTGNGETFSGITYRANEPGGTTWSPAVRIEAGAMDRTLQIGFVRTASFFVTAIDSASLPVAGACYTVYAEAADGARAAIDQACVRPYNSFHPWGEVSLLVPRAGRYVVVETTTPYGYATSAEQRIDVIGTGAQAGAQWVVFYLSRP